jgi:hypothetical protein
MSYLDLAQQLRQLSGKIDKNASRFEGATLAKAATSLTKSIATFEKKLDAFLGGAGPGIRELQELLKSPAATKHLKLPAISLLHRKLFGHSQSAETPAAAKKAFLLAAMGKEMGEETLSELREFLYRAAQIAPPAKDKESLQKEFLRLGGLPDDELIWELDSRFKNITLLKALAKANAVEVTKEVKRERLINSIIHYARRARANIRT